MNKIITIFGAVFFATALCRAQNVGIGTSTPAAKLEISSTSSGVLIPRMAASQRNAIAAPPKGLMVYDTTHSAFFYHDGGRWRPVYEKNYDSATMDYYSNPGAAINFSATNGGTTTINASTNSGYIYDNGGPAGNYLPNVTSSVRIPVDDTTFQLKLTIEEMNAENFYDSLFITDDNNSLDTIATYTSTQTGTIIILNKSIKLSFKANNVVQMAGFKIRWGKMKNNGALQIPAPLYGWHFDNTKIAAMGGLQQNNNWHKDSVGAFSLSYGNGAKAKGDYSIALGDYANALGNSSTSIGENTFAIAFGSTAIGFNTTASGSGATAMGYNTTASGSGATAMGYSTIASGLNSTAIGNETIASGSGATTMGYSTTATGLNSTAMGGFNEATGSYSTAMGGFNEATGHNSTAMGHSTTATGLNSTAMSGGTIANGDYSTAMGFYTNAQSYASLAIGRYNTTNLFPPESGTSWVSTDRAFVIGDGTSDANRSSCFYILKNGNGWMQGTLTQASDARLKKNINRVTGALDKITSLNGYNYYWKRKDADTTLQAGIIAQEMKTVIPELVITTAEGELAVNYNGTIPYLIEAIKELKKQNEEQQKQIEALKKKTAK